MLTVQGDCEKNGPVMFQILMNGPVVNSGAWLKGDCDGDGPVDFITSLVCMACLVLAGLAFDDWDLDYYTQMFVEKVKRNPTSVECFDLAQSNRYSLIVVH